MEESTGFEPVVPFEGHISLAVRRTRPDYANFPLAEGTGIEPATRLRGDCFQDSFLVHSDPFRIYGSPCRIRTYDPLRVKQML